MHVFLVEMYKLHFYAFLKSKQSIVILWADRINHWVNIVLIPLQYAYAVHCESEWS